MNGEQSEIQRYLNQLEEFYNDLIDGRLDSKALESFIKFDIKHFIKNQFGYIDFLPEAVENELRELKKIISNIDNLIDFTELEIYRNCIGEQFYQSNPCRIDSLRHRHDQGRGQSDKGAE